MLVYSVPHVKIVCFSKFWVTLFFVINCSMHCMYMAWSLEGKGFISLILYDISFPVLQSLFLYSKEILTCRWTVSLKQYFFCRFLVLLPMFYFGKDISTKCINYNRWSLVLGFQGWLCRLDRLVSKKVIFWSQRGVGLAKGLLFYG